MIAVGRSAGRDAAIRVLDADPDLAEVLDDGELEEARHALVAPAITLTKGDWSPRQAVPAERGHLGVLVTEGILCREVVIGDSVCAELVGRGDLLRPWDGGDASMLVSCDVRWQVLEEARLAILGRRFVSTAARWPGLTSALVGRAVNRSHALALSATISCTTGIETRLTMLFWHLADRWGKVRPDGVVVPVRMTHDLIARLIGARRPSVSTALKQLEREARITRMSGGGWLLTGDPPSAARPRPASCGEEAGSERGEAGPSGEPPLLELLPQGVTFRDRMAPQPPVASGSSSSATGGQIIAGRAKVSRPREPLRS